MVNTVLKFLAFLCLKHDECTLNYEAIGSIESLKPSACKMAWSVCNRGFPCPDSVLYKLWLITNLYKMNISESLLFSGILCDIKP